MHRLVVISIAGCLAWMVGCKSAPAPQQTGGPTASTAKITYPPRPSVPPPAFKVFHHDASSITLVTKEDATDPEIEAIVWELRDAAHAHSFDKLYISQKLVDARDPKMWFHIYRGARCASEKYASGAPPCGGSYHAAGDYTLGSFKDRDWDSGTLLHGEDNEIDLWQPGAPDTNSQTAVRHS
jgi:hypothetical protein